MRFGWIPAVMVAALFCLPVAAWARDDGQIWTTLNATVKLDDHFRLSEEVVARFSDDRNGLYELESNILVGYRLNGKVTVWAGYTHDPNYAAGHFTVMEHRAREQITFDNLAKIAGGTLSARLRMEQRWREGVDGTGWRLRPYVKYTLPLTGNGGLALVLSHESFVNLNRTGFQNVHGEDRMRNLIALTAPVTRNARVEVGYLDQHGFRRHAEDNDDHTASISLSFSF